MDDDDLPDMISIGDVANLRIDATPDQRVHESAHALTAFRVLANGGERAYTAATFPRGPWQGCEHTIRTLRAIGGLTDQDDSYAILDVLNENADIVQDFGLTRDGFKWLKRKLDLRVEVLGD